MKNKLVKKVVAMSLTAMMAVGMLAGCGSSESGNGAAEGNSAQTTEAASAGDAAEAPSGESKGTIMWMSNLSSGVQYEGMVSYANNLCRSLGYDFQVVYGDSFNDPQGNLTAVKNGMTSNVVALVVSQDGGIKDIMTEYPELYVAGFNTDLLAVYGEGGAATDLQSNDHFLGTIADGHYDGALTGAQMAQAVIEQGYTKVATVMFPGYAYPNLPAAEAEFRAIIEEHNKTAETPIEIVGDALTLEFSPMEESYFMEPGHNDLDAIACFCAGVDFVYPTVKAAMANGACSADTKILTSGFNNDESIVADIGAEGVIQYITISPAENIGYSITLLDKALTGTMYADFTSERIDSLEYVIDSKEDIDNVMTKSMNGTGDETLAQVTAEELAAVTSHADLKALFLSEQLTVDALANR